MIFRRLSGHAGTRDAWAVAAAAFAAYLPSFAGVFQFDDYKVIVDSAAVHSWPAFFERAGTGVRPLLKASYTLNWRLGTGEFGFHFVNIAVHALNAALLCAIGRRLCTGWLDEAQAARARAAAFVAALLFALHPAQTEAVTYISGRSVSLMAAFYLGGVLLYLRGAHWSASALLFVLAAATRETALTLPAALLLCELCARERRHAATILRRQAAHWLLLAAAGMVVVLHAPYRDLLTYGYGERGVGANLLTQVGGVAYLLARLLGLHGYNIDPALPVFTEWDAWLALQAALLAALLALGVANLRARPWLGFGVLWFFLQLAPTNSVVPRLDVANERQLYLACWGLFLALAVQIARLGPARGLARGLVAAAAAAFAASSIARQLDYASEIALWEASVRVAPWNARAHNNLGYAYFLAGRTDDARRAYRRALVLGPAEGRARFNLRAIERDAAPQPRPQREP